MERKISSSNYFPFLCCCPFCRHRSSSSRSCSVALRHVSTCSSGGVSSVAIIGGISFDAKKNIKKKETFDTIIQERSSGKIVSSFASFEMIEELPWPQSRKLMPFREERRIVHQTKKKYLTISFHSTDFLSRYVFDMIFFFESIFLPFLVSFLHFTTLFKYLKI